MENAGVGADNDIILDEDFQDAVEDIQVDGDAPEENIDPQEQVVIVEQPMVAEDEWENAVNVVENNNPNIEDEPAATGNYRTRSDRRVRKPTLQSVVEGH